MPFLKLVGGSYDDKTRRCVAGPDELDFWFKADGTLYDDEGEVARVARYLPAVDSGGARSVLYWAGFVG